MFGNMTLKHAPQITISEEASNHYDAARAGLYELKKLSGVDWVMITDKLFNKVRGVCVGEGIVIGLACAGVAYAVNKTVKKHKEET